VAWVKLTNVMSYLAATDLSVTHPVLGDLKVDVAYGGNFYIIVDPQENFKGLEHYSASALISLSSRLRTIVNDQFPHQFIHPKDSSIRGASHVLWTGATLDAKATARNAVFYGDKAIDRSPCGTGTSARMAQWHAKGLLKEGEKFIHESYIGSQFIGEIVGTGSLGEFPAVVPSIQGWAKVFGHNAISIDEADDPYAFGFQVI
ncbi:MAG: proline racemase family protein, partial [Flavobacteriaceae bacterium]|nr:proline racemase family protein [Flavobacteriaceae bacterium]